MTDERLKGSEEPADEQRPTIRDRRRIDPETGRARTGGSSAAGTPGTSPESPSADASTPDDQPDDELTRARAEAQERLDDLRRLQAEYVNYRRRVERDREATRENAKIEFLAELLPVLDDIGRARDHGDLKGAFRVVAEAVEAVAAKAGLVRFGESGDEFDPTIHEALMHGYGDDVEVPTCTQIIQPGYRLGDRLIRPARVAVTEPTTSLPATEGPEGSTAEGGQDSAADDASQDGNDSTADNSVQGD